MNGLTNNITLSPAGNSAAQAAEMDEALDVLEAASPYPTFCRASGPSPFCRASGPSPFCRGSEDSQSA